MRLAGAFAALLAFAVSFPAFGQWTDVRLPAKVYTAVAFMMDVSPDCPPPGEVAPPPGCNGTMGVWFETADPSAFVPKGFVTLFPFQPVSAGPFTFHRPGLQVVSIFTFSREFIGEAVLVGQVSFVVQPPSGGAKKK